MATLAEIGNYLVKKAKTKDLVSYLDVCREFEMSEDLFPWQGHPLCDIFGSLDEQDARENRPFRTSIVISREYKRPGPGFYAALFALTERNPAHSDKDAVWSKEVDAVFNYYAS